jgi:CubicO group peptidase (beta-lactamase class C family)
MAPGKWIFSIVLCASLQAQDLAAKMDAALTEAANQKRFMGTALVAKGGKILLEKGYGMADLELEVANKPEMKFRLGSITKQFTAAAIMQLQEQGKLSVSGLACQYVDDCPEAWKAVTIHHLLSHTSGIPSYTSMPGFIKPQSIRIPMKPLEIVMLSRNKPMDFQPGEGWLYDNSGYLFLGYIIEKITGGTYASYMEKNIFGRLGMQDSGYDVTSKVMKNRAKGYGRGPEGFRNSDYIDMTLPHAAGSLYSTVHDLYLWDRALYTEKVVSKKSYEAMTTVVRRNYGYGLQLGTFENHKQVAHGGGIPGFGTWIGRFPDDDAVVIVLSNMEGPAAATMSKQLAGLLFAK